jgi:type IV pilus assembly protein PilC
MNPFRNKFLLVVQIGLSLAVSIVLFVLSTGSGWSDMEFMFLVCVGLVMAAPACVMLVYGAWQALVLLIAWIQRKTIERIVIGHIVSVVRQNLPLATALMLASQSERGAARRHLQRISGLLAQGASLSEAMSMSFRERSRLIVSLVAAGERTGQLLPALEQAEDYLLTRSHRRRCFDAPVLAYVILVMGFTALLVSGIMVAIVPKFKVIFADFGTRLPPATESLINVSEWFVQGTPPGWVFLPLVGAMILFSCIVKIRGLSLAARIRQWFRWYMPGLRRMEFGGGLAQMLRLIRSALRGGINLPDAAEIAAGLEVNSRLQDRMRYFGGLLTSGADVGEASRSAGLGPVLATALSGGQRDGDMDAALRYAADYHEAIVARWWVAISTLAWPACTLCLASLVAWVVVALFRPLVALVDSVATMK